MSTQEDLRMYYQEHASQARRHEEQREKVTHIILTLCSGLLALISYVKLAPSSWPAAAAIALLGAYGFLFSGKHYERSRMHTRIARCIRNELDGPGPTYRPMRTLTAEGRAAHYRDFTWPKFNGHEDGSQENAKTWIAKCRLSIFWEGLHLIIALAGCVLLPLIASGAFKEPDEIHRIRIDWPPGTLPSWLVPTKEPGANPPPTPR